MKVSFIVPCYNSDKTLWNCLDSIFKQDFSDSFEVIVVDNASTDNTAKVAKSFPEVIYYYEKIPGRSQARNRGAGIAKGVYLAFIDSDVILDQHWLKIMFQHAVDSIVGLQGIIKPMPSHLSPFLDQYRDFLFLERKSVDYNLLKMRIAESPMINTASCIYRRTQFLSMGGFDDQLSRHEDIDFSKRLFLSGHHLQCTKAISYVYYDQSLFNYLKRSFDEGVSKVNYLNKWQAIEYANIKLTFIMQLAVLIKLTIFTIMKGLLCFNPYLIFMGINNTLRFMGRAYGLLHKDKTCEALSLVTQDSIIYDEDKIVLRYNADTTTFEEVR